MMILFTYIPQLERPIALLKIAIHGKKYNPPYISCSDIYNIVYDKKPLTFYSTRCSDSYYRLVHFNQVSDFIIKDKTNEYKYSKDNKDCDDFAKVCFGNFLKFHWYNNTNFVFGIASGFYNHDHGQRHAFNFFITPNKNVYAVEPQTDKILPYDDFPYIIDAIDI